MPELVLRVVRGAGQGRDIRVSEELVIGREAEGDGRLDGEPALSRRHARVFRRAGGTLTIEDLGSLNGTHVNGERIGSAVTLGPGDEVRLGETVLVVADAGSPPPTRARASDTVLVDAPAVPPPPGAGEPRPGTAARRGGGLAEIADRPAARLVAIALAVALVAAWLLTRGGDGNDRGAIVDDGRRSTVQLVVQPSPVVSALAARAPATAPPRSGSGIVVDARRGLILTADRLVAGAVRISARFGSGRTRRAALVARAPCDGLALVRLPGLPGGARAAQTGAAAELKPGDRVFALGYPGSLVGTGNVRGRALRAAPGRVASVRRRARLDPADPRLSGLVVHTARTGAGGAGGPLVNADGEVVGVNLVAPDSGRFADAVAMERAQGMYGDLATARTEADAGWRLEPWSEIRGGGARGLLVTGVDRGGPASRVRVRRARRPSNPLLGATVFAVDGRPVNDVADVCAALRGVRRGQRVSVRADVTTRGLGRPSRARAVRVRMRL